MSGTVLVARCERVKFGRWVGESGLALPLIVLGLAQLWALPLLAGIAGGDIFAAEDRQHCWESLLTRSRTRSDLFCGQVVAALGSAALFLGTVTVSSLSAGLLVDRTGLVGPPAHRNPRLASGGQGGCVEHRVSAAAEPGTAQLPPAGLHMIVPRAGRLIAIGLWLAAGLGCSSSAVTAPDRGSGDDWECRVSWHASDGAERETVYEVQVRTSGCYTATGPQSDVGPPLLNTADGGRAVNPIYQFDGCFDPA
jgi:hypothetical protein